MADNVGAQLPDCIPNTTAEGYGIDAEQICFDAGPSPLWRTVTYKISDGTLVNVKFYNDLGVETAPVGSEIPCAGGAAANVSVVGPIGSGSCASAVRVTQCETVDIDIVAQSGGSLAVNDDGGSLTVDGSVSVSNFPAFPADIEAGWQYYCDFVAYPAGTVFLRRYDLVSGVVTPVDTLLDGVTPYVPVGIVVPCELAQFDFEPLVFCDSATGTKFLRNFVNTFGGPIVTDTLFDGVTPYVVVGTAEVCPVIIDSTTPVSVVQAPRTIREGRFVLSGIGTWDVATDTGGGRVTSVTFRVRAEGAGGSITIDDDFGNTTTLLQDEVESWSVAGPNDELADTLMVTTTNAGDEVVVLWTEET